MPTCSPVFGSLAAQSSACSSVWCKRSVGYLLLLAWLRMSSGPVCWDLRCRRSREKFLTIASGCLQRGKTSTSDDIDFRFLVSWALTRTYWKKYEQSTWNSFYPFHITPCSSQVKRIAIVLDIPHAASGCISSGCFVLSTEKNLPTRCCSEAKSIHRGGRLMIQLADYVAQGE